MSEISNKIDLIQASMDRLIRQPCAMPFLIPVDFNNTEYYENFFKSNNGKYFTKQILKINSMEE